MPRQRTVAPELRMSKIQNVRCPGGGHRAAAKEMFHQRVVVHLSHGEDDSI